MMKNPNWTLEEDQLLKLHYLENGGPQKLQELLLNRNYNAIKARSNFLGLKRHIPYTKDENFFNEPNIINNAISGLIESDGNITDKKFYENGSIKSNGKVSISLDIKDIEILNLIKNITKFTGKITISTRKTSIKNYRNPILPSKTYSSTMANLTFSNAEKWKFDLNKNWNITPRKSLTMEAPNLVELDHILAFYSGAICGDGTIDIQKENLRITLLGTFKFLNFFRSTINQIIPIGLDAEVRKERKNSNIYSYRISGAKAYIIANMMLAMDIPRLNRKWDIVKQHLLIKDRHHKFLFALKRGITPKVVEFLNKYNKKIFIPNRKPITEKSKNNFEQIRRKNSNLTDFFKKIDSSKLLEPKTVNSITTTDENPEILKNECI